MTPDPPPLPPPAVPLSAQLLDSHESHIPLSLKLLLLTSFCDWYWFLIQKVMLQMLDKIDAILRIDSQSGGVGRLVG